MHRVRFNAEALLHHTSVPNPPQLKWSAGISVGACCWHQESDPGHRSGSASSISVAEILWHFRETMVNFYFEKLFGVLKPMLLRAFGRTMSIATLKICAIWVSGVFISKFLFIKIY